MPRQTSNREAWRVTFIRQCPGKAGDRKVRRRGPIDDRRNDARRQEGKRDEQADVPFSLDLTFGNLGWSVDGRVPGHEGPDLLFEPTRRWWDLRFAPLPRTWE